MKCPLFAVLVPAVALAVFTAAAQDAPAVKIGILADGNAGLWNAAMAAAKEVAGEKGAALTLEIPSPATPEAQRELAEKMIADGVKALAVAPVNAEKQVEFLKELAAKIPLVLLMNDAPDSGRVCFIGEDPAEAGRALGALTDKALPHGMKVAVFAGNPGASPEKERIAGLRESLAPGDYTLDVLSTDHGDRSLLRALADELLQNRPEIGAYFGLSAYHAGVLWEAAKEINRERMISVLVCGDSAEARAGLDTGGIFAVAITDAVALGRETALTLAGLAGAGERRELPGDGKITLTPKTVVTEKTRSVEDVLDALQIPRVLEETTTIPRPTFD